MTPFEDLPVWTMAEWMGQKAEIDRLHAELAETRSENDELCAMSLEFQAALAAIARVRELCVHTLTEGPALLVLRALDGAERAAGSTAGVSASPTSLHRKTTCRLGIHKFVEYRCSDGPPEWNPFLRGVYPASRAYWACISCLEPRTEQP